MATAQAATCIAYVTSEKDHAITMIDVQGMAVVGTIATCQRPRRFAFNADASEIWVSNELGASVSVISLEDMAVSHAVKLEVNGLRIKHITPVDLKLSKDGKTMIVGLGQANRVAFVDATSKQVGQLALAGKRAWGLGVSPMAPRCGWPMACPTT